MKDTFGIPHDQWRQIIETLAMASKAQRIVLFGSRAKGTQRDGSDIDLCLHGDVDASVLPSLQLTYDELYLPWKLDVVIYDTIKELALKEHIDRVGRVVYEASSSTSIQ
jgi:uncharacterized protein